MVLPILPCSLVYILCWQLDWGPISDIFTWLGVSPKLTLPPAQHGAHGGQQQQSPGKEVSRWLVLYGLRYSDELGARWNPQVHVVE